jgi:hypothetical protein
MVNGLGVITMSSGNVFTPLEKEKYVTFIGL